MSELTKVLKIPSNGLEIMSNIKQDLINIEAKDFVNLGKISLYVKNKIHEKNLKYIIPTKKQRDDILLMLIKYLLTDSPIVAGSHRKKQWEDGWLENLKDYSKSKNLDSLIPKYFEKYKVQRLKGDFILTQSDNFEIGLVSILQYIIFEKYFKDSKSVYEFGAGTGHNLLRLREINKGAALYAMEWAKTGVEIIKNVAKDLNDNNLYGTVFDNFNPDFDIKLQPNSSIYTFAALEQLGSNTDSLIEYWIANKAKIIVNIEPMSEPLDNNELLQYLSISYFKKRGYLEGYINKLKYLEKKGRIVIHEIVRTEIGSLFIEGYSIISWSPAEDTSFDAPIIKGADSI